MAAFMSGFISFFSPCILPLIPAYLIFMSGISASHYTEGNPKKYRKIVLFHAFFFIIGFSLVFISLGLATSLLARFFLAYQVYITRIGGLVLILFGLSFLRLIQIPGLESEKKIHLEEKPAGFLGTFLLGMAFSLCWSPCIDTTLSSILTVAGSSMNAGQGFYLLTLYSAGLALPFLIAALLFHRIFALLKPFSAVSRYSMKILGAMLVIIGLILFLGLYGELGLLFQRVFG